MLHIIKIMVDKTRFRLNKSYMLDLSAEMMGWAEFCDLIQPNDCSIVGFTRHSAVIFILGGGNPCGAEKRQPGEEIEEGHYPQYRAKRRAGRGFH